METNLSLLTSIEPRLRHLLPADLYAATWADPSSLNLMMVFDHLRTLKRILSDYLPRQAVEEPPQPGVTSHGWQEGALMFTDLAGFSGLVEAQAGRGQAGADTLRDVLNAYFSAMIEVVGKSGGNLIEFTGDAMLIRFSALLRAEEVRLAVRAGLRMQRAMGQFHRIETDKGDFSLAQRIGIHSGRYFTATIGTPRRMEHVLLGMAVQRAKEAESRGEKGRVNLSKEAYALVEDNFHFDVGELGHMLVIDDLGEESLGDYEMTSRIRRRSSTVIFDRSPEGLVQEIESLLDQVEPLACFQPKPILNLLIRSAEDRHVPSELSEPTTIFVNLIGLPDVIDGANDEEAGEIVKTFTRLFARIDAAVVARGGVVKRVTYHLSGSDLLIIFGVPEAHTDDARRAAEAALMIRELVEDANTDPLVVGGEVVEISCQMGIAQGSTFAAEIGEARGRREYNVHGDAVNTAARLMGKAVGNRILITEAVKSELGEQFNCMSLGKMPLKGKANRVRIFALSNR